ncbi:hypothetical protein ES705_30414 [subsurface metagenome]
MAKLTAMPHQAIVDGLKGTIDFYLWRGIPVARKWPRSPGPRRAPAVEAQWEAWSYASRIWSLMDDETKQSYIATSAGTNLSGRDLAVKAYLSGYLKA